MVVLALAFVQMITQTLQPPNEKIQAGAVGMQVNDADRVAGDVQNMIRVRHMLIGRLVKPQLSEYALPRRSRQAHRARPSGYSSTTSTCPYRPMTG